MSYLKETLKEKRPNLSQSSINTYASTLRTLYAKVFEKIDEENPIDLDKFVSQQDKIVSALQDVPLSRKKTTLSALYVLTGDEVYRDLMVDSSMKGQAVDFTKVANGKPLGEVFEFIATRLNFDQAIWEKGNDGNPKWIHVSYNNSPGAKQRKKLLRFFGNGRYVKCNAQGEI